jgi:Transposase Tn5 dimerisation domain/Transposase DNA-binding
MTPFPADFDWARQEMAFAQVWDARCRRSLTTLCHHLACSPGLSFSAACGTASRQAAHRLFSHESTSVPGLLQGHFLQTVARADAYPLLLVAQDTTELNFTTHPKTTGLGSLGGGPNARGLLLHSALAFAPDGLPLGLLHLQFWARPPKLRGQKHQRRERSTSQKESRKWIDTLQAVEAKLPPSQPVLLIQDREADVFDFLAWPRRPQTHLLVRATQPRRVLLPASSADEGDPQGTLLQVASEAPVVGERTVAVPARKGQEGRQATMSVQMTPLWVLAPKGRALAQEAPAVLLWVIRAVEREPPAGEKPIGWVLLTTLPVADGEGACQRVEQYAKRWGIERFHYTLKSGCRVERLQMETAETLMKAIGLYGVVAWRLLYLTHVGRVWPEAPAREVVTEEEREVLSARGKGEVRTAREAVRAIAKLGGFEGYPAAGEAGVKSLWQGVRRLQAMVEGWRLARATLPP